MFPHGHWCKGGVWVCACTPRFAAGKCCAHGILWAVSLFIGVIVRFMIGGSFLHLPQILRFGWWIVLMAPFLQYGFFYGGGRWGPWRVPGGFLQSTGKNVICGFQLSFFFRGLTPNIFPPAASPSVPSPPVPCSPFFPVRPTVIGRPKPKKPPPASFLLKEFHVLEKTN